jgi:hypothetical protein
MRTYVFLLRELVPVQVIGGLMFGKNKGFSVQVSGFRRQTTDDRKQKVIGYWLLV